jgi:putative FmdB family regulatory protein
MPLYTYECEDHGFFSDWRAMSESEQPLPCPMCGWLSERTVSAPYLGMASGLKHIHGANEKSAHEPRVVRRRRGDPIPSHEVHRDLTVRHSHNHSHHGHSHSHDANGRTSHASHHPWMVRNC